MQDENNSPSNVYDLVQLAQQAFAQARANLERARILTEMGETYLESARLAECSAPKTPDTATAVDKDRLRTVRSRAS